MSTVNEENIPANSTAETLRELCQFDGGAGEFWKRYLQAIALHTNASSAALVVRTGSGENAEWKIVAAFPANRNAAGWATLTESLVDTSINDGVTRLGSADLDATTSSLCARLALPGAEALIAIETDADNQQAAASLLTALPVAELAEWRRTGDAARQDAARFGAILDLLIQLAGQDRFYSACMLLCNELCGRLACDRVSLGWVDSDRIKLRAVSHTEKIDVKMELARSLEAAMDEALDQGEEVVIPRIEGQSAITRDHENYARAHGSKVVASFPLARPTKDGEEKPREPEFAAVLTLERGEVAFSPADLGMVRLLALQAGPPLCALHARDKWFGARWAAWGRERFAGLLGTSHTWWKVVGLLLTLLVLALIFVHIEHRVKGTFAIRTDSMAQLTAPFPGHLLRVDARVGDEVSKNDPLFALDDRELRLQRHTAEAELERFQTEASRAESTGDLATMRVAMARQRQAAAQLELANHQLAQSVITTPINGVVVEGDLRERIAAPVDKGELLMKVARLDGMYLMVDILESDIDLLTPEARGQAVFASQPDRKFAFTIERIHPVAQVGDAGNTFPVRCLFEEDPEDWWRPGMTGVAKIDAGRQSLLWIATRRTMDAMRLRFW